MFVQLIKALFPAGVYAPDLITFSGIYFAERRRFLPAIGSLGFTGFDWTFVLYPEGGLVSNFTLILVESETPTVVPEFAFTCLNALALPAGNSLVGTPLSVPW